MAEVEYEYIIDPEKFLPIGTINVLRGPGSWDLTIENWIIQINALEKRALSIIRASINLKMIEEDEELIKELLTQYIQSQLLLPLIHEVGMRENGEIALELFNEMMVRIKENQRESGITPDEESTKTVPGIMVF